MIPVDAGADLLDDALQVHAGARQAGEAANDGVRRGLRCGLVGPLPALQRAILVALLAQGVTQVALPADLGLDHLLRAEVRVLDGLDRADLGDGRSVGLELVFLVPLIFLALLLLLLEAAQAALVLAVLLAEGALLFDLLIALGPVHAAVDAASDCSECSECHVIPQRIPSCFS